jgi:tRNA-intron endonuclease, archaea type
MEATAPAAEGAQVAAFEARLRRGRVVVEDASRFQELEQAGYGEREGKKYALKDYEALYLLNAGKLSLSDEVGKEVSFNALAEMAQGEASEAWTRFLIYRDLRTRGYVVKEGFGFGTDLRVYERGEFPKKAAKYVVFALDEGIETDVEDLRISVKEITKMGKEAIIAVLERRGEVIYYKVSKAHFKR